MSSPFGCAALTVGQTVMFSTLIHNIQGGIGVSSETRSVPVSIAVTTRFRPSRKPPGVWSCPRWQDRTHMQNAPICSSGDRTVS